MQMMRILDSLGRRKSPFSSNAIIMLFEDLGLLGSCVTVVGFVYCVVMFVYCVEGNVSPSLEQDMDKDSPVEDVSLARRSPTPEEGREHTHSRSPAAAVEDVKRTNSRSRSRSPAGAAAEVSPGHYLGDVVPTCLNEIPRGREGLGYNASCSSRSRPRSFNILTSFDSMSGVGQSMIWSDPICSGRSPSPEQDMDKDVSPAGRGGRSPTLEEK